MDDDEKVLELVRPSEVDGVTERRGEPAEGDDTLPQPGDDYLAAGRAGNRPEAMLCLILRDHSYQLFSYGSLVRARLAPSLTPAAGPALTLRFLADALTDVTFEGRRLVDLIHNLRRHRIPWLREAPTDRYFADRKAVAITRITIALAEGHW